MKPNPNPNPNQNQNQNATRGEPTPLVTTPTKKVTLQPKGGDEVNKFSSFKMSAHLITIMNDIANSM